MDGQSDPHFLTVSYEAGMNPLTLPSLGRKKSWASQGVQVVKFTAQEDTPGAFRAVSAEFNRSREDHSEGGAKHG